MIVFWSRHEHSDVSRNHLIENGSPANQLSSCSIYWVNHCGTRVRFPAKVIKTDLPTYVVHIRGHKGQNSTETGCCGFAALGNLNVTGFFCPLKKCLEITMLWFNCLHFLMSRFFGLGISMSWLFGVGIPMCSTILVPPRN